MHSGYKFFSLMHFGLYHTCVICEGWWMSTLQDSPLIITQAQTKDNIIDLARDESEGEGNWEWEKGREEREWVRQEKTRG